MNILRVLSISLVLIFLSDVSLLASPGPTEILKPTLQGMIDIMKDPALAGIEQKVPRRKKIMAIAAQGFDFAEMSKLVLGKTWRKIDQQQRTNFEQLFTKLLENAYIGKLEGYSGQIIEYKGERIKGKKAAVSTVVRSPEEPPLAVNYVMINVDSRWQVYDINIEGVSLLRNYREQFKSILRKDKFEGLVKVIEKKNKSFEKEVSR
ncbi:MAG: ABC transporter substrate-binding protein [Desulfocapsa sp.]|nr:ABC transporter substrate-binding protein [Desulfocapsa sp.]